MKYCPIIDGHLYTGVCAVGQVGVWRLINSEYDYCDATLMNQIAELEQPFQPEVEKFVIIEISTGRWTSFSLCQFCIKKLIQVRSNILQLI